MSYKDYIGMILPYPLRTTSKSGCIGCSGVNKPSVVQVMDLFILKKTQSRVFRRDP